MANVAENKEVLMKCRRGSDVITRGQSCNSMKALKLGSDTVSKAPKFKCCKCGFEWVVVIGGSFVGM